MYQPKLPSNISIPEKAEMEQQIPSSQNFKKRQDDDLLRMLAESTIGIQYKQLVDILQDERNDRRIGSLFGAFMGDALGSYCEFKNRATSTKLSQKAMEMPGGGPFSLNPGQVTDDSELALHILKSLLEAYNPKKSLKEQYKQIQLKNAREFLQWYNNYPFDIGYTTQKACIKFSKFITSADNSTNQPFDKQYNNMQKAWMAIDIDNFNSLSNGFMMRATPLACFASLVQQFKSQQYEQVIQIIYGDTKNTHSNPICLHGIKVYVETISKLILRKSHSQIQKIVEDIRKLCDESAQNQQKDLIFSTISEAFADYQQKKNTLKADGGQAGFFRIAFYYTFYNLLKIARQCKEQSQLSGNLYKQIMKSVIAEGGDTDTNACIVGGVIGAVVGFQNLPYEYKQKSLTLKLGESDRRKNQKMYQPKNGLKDLVKLIKLFK